MKFLRAEAIVINRTFKNLNVLSGVRKASDIIVSPYGAITYQLTKVPGTTVKTIEKHIGEIETSLSRFRKTETQVIFNSKLLTLTVNNPNKKKLLFRPETLNHPDIGLNDMLIGVITQGNYINNIQTVNFLVHHHILIAGTSGSGKSVLLKTMLTSLAIKEEDSVDVMLIDLKNEDLVPFIDFPFTVGFAGTEDEADVMVSRAYNEMINRIENRIKNPKPLVLVIDEFPAITNKDTIKLIELISGRGRSKNVHLLLTIQHPTEKSGLTSVIKNNLALKIVGKVNGKTASNVATQNVEIEAHKLEGKGQFFFIEDNEYFMIQGYMITDEQIQDVLDSLPGRRKPLQIASTKAAVEPVYAPPESDVEILAEKISDMWLDKASISSMIRFVYGENANTGGANHRKIKEAVAWLEENNQKKNISFELDDDDKIIKLFKKVA